jgi:hypothetical protein
MMVDVAAFSSEDGIIMLKLHAANTAFFVCFERSVKVGSRDFLNDCARVSDVNCSNLLLKF